VPKGVCLDMLGGGSAVMWILALLWGGRKGCCGYGERNGAHLIKGL